jgi:phenylacetate-CoA ligase
MSESEGFVSDAVSRYRHSQGGRVLELLSSAAGVDALARRLAQAGLDGIETVEELHRLPVLPKDSLPELQRAHPPLGGLLGATASVVRLFASPGPIYEPQLAGEDPWHWGPALAACGIGPGDVVLNCFSYHLSPAGAMFDEACRSVGAVVVPAGVGGLDVQAQVVEELGVTAYVGLPSYLSALIEKYDAAGLAPGRWRLTKALVTAEPLPPALRADLRRRVATVLMAYGTAECGLIAFETSPEQGLQLAPTVYVEVCDPSSGEPVLAGEPGEVVVSVLHEDYPLLRLGTGDVSRWVVDAEGPDGAPRLAGVLGRVGAAVKVRGMFVYPHQASRVVQSLQDLGAETGRFVVERTGERDVLRLELVAGPGSDEEHLREAAVDRARAMLRLAPEVVLVDAVEQGPLVDVRDWS